MKKTMLTVVFVMIALLLQAQEVMKVELNKGETVEYKVDDIKRVYFDTKTPGEEDDIKTDYLVMFIGDQKKIEGTVVTATSENDFVASVKDNIVTANHVGATIIFVNEKHPVIIMVFSLNTSIPDPVLKWGEPKDTIKAHHTKGTIDKDTDTALTYKNCGDASLIGYTFDADGKLYGALISVTSSKYLVLYNYLKERYYIYPEKQSDGGYLGFDGYDKEHIKTVIMYYPSSNSCAFMSYSMFLKDESKARKSLSRIKKNWVLDTE